MIVSNDFFSNLRIDYQKEYFENFLTFKNFKFNIKAIHIAGTNGKGSTAKYLANVYQCAGYKVGLFVSPFLNDITEMISIDGVDISKEKLFEYINDEQQDFIKFDLSQFEILTYIALKYFQEEECDVAIIECGMGGELDATNFITPIASVITSISIEHTSYLGNSLTDIALHKGGIIKSKVPVIVGKLPEEALLVIKSIAVAKRAPLIETSDAFNVEISPTIANFSYSNFTIMQIKNAAQYSIDDACIAIEVVKALRDILPFTSTDLFRGLISTEVICRNEVIFHNPLTILDGAHNPEAISRLIESLRKIYPGQQFHVVFAAFKDKNITTMLSTLSSLTDDITLTSFSHNRCRGKDDYFLFLEEHPYVENHVEAIKNVIGKYPNDILLVTGSLAFVGVVRKEFIDGRYKK